MSTHLPPFKTFNRPPALVRDLRSDHAGETGAVAIYQGILAVSRDKGVRRFAVNHMKTEKKHLSFFAGWLPPRYWSRLLPVWTAAGWSLGALAALFGPGAVFRTIAAVESFVEGHYVEQIEKMRDVADLQPLAETLQSFCDDEVEHLEDAARRQPSSSGIIARAWRQVVGAGSALGVVVARKV